MCGHSGKHHAAVDKPALHPERRRGSPRGGRWLAVEHTASLHLRQEDAPSGSDTLQSSFRRLYTGKSAKMSPTNYPVDHDLYLALESVT